MRDCYFQIYFRCSSLVSVLNILNTYLQHQGQINKLSA